MLPHTPPPPSHGPAADPHIPKWDGGAEGWPIYQLRFKTWFELSQFTSVTDFSVTTVENAHLSQLARQKLVNTLPTKSLGPFLNNSTYLHRGFEMWAKVEAIQSPSGPLAFIAPTSPATSNSG